MLRDAEFVYIAEKTDGTRRLLSACRALGTANALLGRPQEAIDVFGEALALSGHRPELAHVRLYCLSYMAFAATDIGDRRNAQRWAVEALQADRRSASRGRSPERNRLRGRTLANQQRGDHTAAARQLDHVRRLGPSLHGVPWLEADCALHCADISLNLGDLAGALEFALVASDALEGYPDAGTLPARLQRLEERIRRGEDYKLTPAELRLISFLPTHLSLQEIADHLHLSRPTVKTQVASIYHKLGVKTRSEAVEIVELTGLGAIDRRLTISDPASD